ncbi:TVP38/TMEM64 family protein [Pseudooceanicola nitratireducens]|jgi:uncharacterized membrane protein YdjX (TVP38/TMEM64 family)|uniref:TVP38/TMEM64 family protein n=1 Tax=Pseudooceanicola nitratireducens TaxID=517719 RepID=UPI003517F4BF
MTALEHIRHVKILGAVLGLVLIAVLAIAWLSGFQPGGFTKDQVADWVDAAGAWGPVAVVTLMVIAVVASPIPSAPIALAAGAAYGHTLGALFVAVGSEIGALLAFWIARTLGRRGVERLLGGADTKGLLGSQNALTLTVFFSRLLPFVSFDAMSYAAGLSRLHAWRFALATLAGILPASFVLAHIGSVALNGDIGSAERVALILGFLTATPLVLLAMNRKRDDESGEP